jgi:hypothetical protein
LRRKMARSQAVCAVGLFAMPEQVQTRKLGIHLGDFRLQAHKRDIS